MKQIKSLIMWGFLSGLADAIGAVVSISNPGIGAAVIAGGTILGQIGTHEQIASQKSKNYKSQEFTRGAAAYNASLKQYYGLKDEDWSSSIKVEGVKQPKLNDYIDATIQSSNSYDINSKGYITDPGQKKLLYSGLQKPDDPLTMSEATNGIGGAINSAYTLNEAYTKYKSTKAKK